MSNEIEKGYTKKKYRRKIPKVVRWYDKHRNEDKTFDKSEDDELQENNMSKSIEKEIEGVAKSMAETANPNEAVIQTIENLGPEGLKKAMETLNDEQKELLKSVLTDMKKGQMDLDTVTPKKEMTRLDQSGAELENGSDDEDEKVMQAAESSVNPQGDVSPKGRDNHVIKSTDVEAIIEETLSKGFPGSDDEKEDKKIAQKEAKKEVKEHEKDMHKMKKSKEELVEMKNQIIKSYEDAGLEYNDELIKGQMKKMLKEEDQVEMGGQDKGGKADRADKKAPKDIKVGEDASETADEVKVKKSLVFEKDENSLLKACTNGRNYHYSINAHYDDALAKSKEEPKTEELKKSETDAPSICDIIEKGGDMDADSVITAELIKSHKTNGNYSETFSSVDMVEAMGLTEEEAKEILGE